MYSVKYVEGRGVQRLRGGGFRLSTSQIDQLELSSVQVLPGGGGFMLEVRTPEQQSLQLRFSVATLYQLMRVLPRIDAALHQSVEGLSSALLAYPVIDWAAEHVGLDGGVAISLRTDRHVESGFAFDLDAAQRFCRDLGAAITAAKHAPVPHDVVSLAG